MLLSSPAAASITAAQKTPSTTAFTPSISAKTPRFAISRSIMAPAPAQAKYSIQFPNSISKKAPTPKPNLSKFAASTLLIASPKPN